MASALAKENRARAEHGGAVLSVANDRVLGAVIDRHVQNVLLVFQIVFQHVRLMQGHSPAVEMHPHPAVGFM